jgi:hypothetical protein
MRRLTATAACVLALTASMIMASAGTADAATPTTSARTSASLPKTVLKLRSIEWQRRSGAVEVSARVKCTGRGTFSWQVSLEQKKSRDKGSAKVPCDGDGFLSTIVLAAKHGRFHPGSAEFGYGSVTTGPDSGIGFFVLEHIRISPR